mmetsp:Transcript_50568/g.118087  ORF Transcript_50568/g.118087 Transcript_50568/m.118087 type:complete len:236 (+) Transcript_50568:2400-3107(+)
MVVLLVEVPQVVEIQVRNLPWISTIVSPIWIVRKDGLHGQAAVGVVWIRINAFHLIEHDTLVLQWVLLVLQLIVPTLLLEDVGIADGSGVKHCIQVNIYEVVEILKVAACNRVERTVWHGERIEEGLQTRLQQLCKGLLDWVFPASAEHGVLQYMCDAVGVLWWSAEDYTEGLVLIRWLHHGDQLCLALVVLKEVASAPKLLDILNPLARETMELLTDFILHFHRSLHDGPCRAR